MPFLEYDLLDTLPYTVASALAVFPKCLHNDIVQLLCTNLLPFTLGNCSLCLNYCTNLPWEEINIHAGMYTPNSINLFCMGFCSAGFDGLNSEQTYASDSTSAILMLVLQHVQNIGGSQFKKS